MEDQLAVAAIGLLEMVAVVGLYASAFVVWWLIRPHHGPAE